MESRHAQTFSRFDVPTLTAQTFNVITFSTFKPLTFKHSKSIKKGTRSNVYRSNFREKLTVEHFQKSGDVPTYDVPTFRKVLPLKRLERLRIPRQKRLNVKMFER